MKTSEQIVRDMSEAKDSEKEFYRNCLHVVLAGVYDQQTHELNLNASKLWLSNLKHRIKESDDKTIYKEEVAALKKRIKWLKYLLS